ncbi:MAG: hypothetical protein IJ634_01420 [Bacteroidales bacterium]|nr:hypothetical protein [Bacteroidales bacterium]
MEEQNLKLQDEVKQYVHSMGRWYKFFGILAIVGCALMVLGALMMLLTGGMMGSIMENASASAMYDADIAAAAGMGSMPFWLLGIFYLIGAGTEVPIIIYLLRGAKAAETAVALNSNEAAASFLANSKSYWKYYGILTIVVLAFCIIVLPIIIIGAVAAAL